MRYNKPALTIQQQVNLLRDRGLVVKDEEKAIHYLSNISYYRIRAYMLPFQKANDPNHNFLNTTTFDQILDLYVFDRELRLLVLDAIERIEIAFRTQIIYQYSLEYDPYFLEDASHFWRKDRHKKILDNLDKEAERSHEVFIGHYRKKYSEPVRPPAWMLLEISSMNTLSNTFKFLKRSRTKKAVAKQFSLDVQVMESWLHAITYVRNISAHHSRLWNRKLTIKPQMLTNPVLPWTEKRPDDTKLYGFLCCLKYLLNTVNPKTSFTDYLCALLKKHPDVPLKNMGFPDAWLKDPVWKSLR